MSDGSRILVGLTLAETSEFDELSYYPRPAHYDQAMARAADARWMELYLKHEEAWQRLCELRDSATLKRYTVSAGGT